MKKRALLIAEKPSLMKAIQKAYGKIKHDLDFEIDFTSFIGHFMALKYPEEYKEEWKDWKAETLPIIPEKFEFKVSKDKEKPFKNVKEQVFQNYDFVINACDAGREGQAIFWFFYDHIGGKHPVKRLWASDNTVATLGKALSKLRDSSEPALDNMKYSSFYRAQLDWLLGMNLTRAISIKTSKKINIGRVKTPTLKIIVDRDLEILNFKPEDYFEVVADFDIYKGNWFKDKETSFKSKELADKMISQIGKDGVVDSVETERKTEYAPPLFNLGELQAIANEKFKFTAKKTLTVAQSLYETHKIITYPRTESKALSTEIAKEITSHLKAIEGIKEVSPYVSKILGDKARIDSTMGSKKYVDNSKVTDHHAIIPTQDKANLSALSKDELNLYMLIVTQFVAIFLDPYLADKTTIITKVKDETFRTTGSILIDKGYKVLYDYNKNDDVIPNVTKGQKLTVKGFEVEKKTTKPPPPYTEKMLIRAMASAGKFVEEEELKQVLKDSAGIGTSATRADIIEGLVDIGMIKREKTKMLATPFGFKVIEILGDRGITSPALTAEWEDKLLQIESGKLDKHDFHKEMIKFVEDQTADFLNNINVTLSSDETQEVIGTCPKCGNPVLYGKNYYVCKEYKQSCDFIVGQTINGAKISVKDMEKILNGQATGEKSFVKKAKKEGEKDTKFKAQLKWNKEEGRVKFFFKDSVEASNETLGSCPKCGKVVTDKGNYAPCADYKNGCDFVLSRTISGANLTNGELSALLSGQETKEHEFKFKSGKTGSGKLKYNKEEQKIEFVFGSSEQEHIGQCPICNSDFIFYGEYAKCSDTNCGTSFSTKIMGATLKKEDIIALINGKTTNEHTFKWKSGKKGEAKLSFDKENKKLGFVFEDTSKAEKKEIGNCPKCKKPVIDYGTYCKCSECDFSLSKTISGAKLNDSNIKKLLEGNETSKLKMTFKSGKSGDAKLKYENGKLNFIFD